FWQASEEVEEEILDARSAVTDFGQRPVVNEKKIKLMRNDTNMGMIFSNMITFFIILTTAATLNKNGILTIESPQTAALALRPLAGDFAYILFAVGIIAIGLQSIPVLAGSIAYSVSEALGIKEGLSKKFSDAKGFYLIIAIATLIGVLLNLIGVNNIQALFYASIVNGVLAVPLIFIIIRMADDKKIVGKFTNRIVGRVIAWTLFIFMSASVLLMFGSIFD
ncbi:MAG: Natural resistance-associated macrophage protein, partial [Candidatus Collierbacteria bacterium GW2011_GWB1_44_6]